MNSTAVTAEVDEDPRKYFWFAVYILINAFRLHFPMPYLRILRLAQQRISARLS